jgi:hypothetical protein
VKITMIALCRKVTRRPTTGFAGIVVVALLCLSGRTDAQSDNPDDPASITREDWKARVDAAKARVQQMRREGEPFIPRAEDNPLRRILQDGTLVYGDIVVTDQGVFEFIGATTGPHNREEFRQLNRDKVLPQR